MNEINILIIGAGAAGLIAARELARSGKRVTILEARNRVGGRIYTQTEGGFSEYVEAGAEFVHGDLPLTQALLNEAHISCYPLAGKTYQVKKGELSEAEEFIPDFPVLLQKLEELPRDLPFAAFLDQYLFEAQYSDLRNAVIRFAEGYDAADIKKVSTFALRDEWKNGGAANSFHPKEGYGRVIEFLASQCKEFGCTLQLQSIVHEIKWEPGLVLVKCSQGQQYRARQVLITVPLGVLQAEPERAGSIKFVPDIPEIRKAVSLIGFGAVIKICLEFKSTFWAEQALPESSLRQTPELAFLFSDKHLFTAWWTQLPNPTPLLTAWLAGPSAAELKNETDADLIAKSLAELADIYNTSTSFLKEQLQAAKVFNWAADPFAQGAYAYATVDSATANQVLVQPVAGTLYFAGEGIYLGHAMGTVEAALTSGLHVAHELLL